MEKLLTRTFSGGLRCPLLLSKKLACNQCDATFVLEKVLSCCIEKLLTKALSREGCSVHTGKEDEI